MIQGHMIPWSDKMTQTLEFKTTISSINLFSLNVCWQNSLVNSCSLVAFQSYALGLLNEQILTFLFRVHRWMMIMMVTLSGTDATKQAQTMIHPLTCFTDYKQSVSSLSCLFTQCPHDVYATIHSHTSCQHGKDICNSLVQLKVTHA